MDAREAASALIKYYVGYEPSAGEVDALAEKIVKEIGLMFITASKARGRASIV